MKGISEKIKRTIFTVFGTIFLIMGAIGVFIPVLPTTPFLLLAAACYLRGSERLHRWLINNRVFGEFIRNYTEGRGIKQRQKIYTISFLWLMIIFSIIYVVENYLFRISLLLITLVVTIHIMILPTIKQSNSE
jgi:uncharacterized membrane protein YbaN (DUF454 family)